MFVCICFNIIQGNKFPDYLILAVKSSICVYGQTYIIKHINNIFAVLWRITIITEIRNEMLFITSNYMVDAIKYSRKILRWLIWVNSSPPSAAYMCQWIGSTLVQKMVCRLFGAKPLSKPMLAYINWTHKNKLPWILNRNTKLFIDENAFENVVCQIGGHCVQGGWVNSLRPRQHGCHFQPHFLMYFLE